MSKSKSVESVRRNDGHARSRWWNRPVPPASGPPPERLRTASSTRHGMVKARATPAAKSNRGQTVRARRAEAARAANTMHPASRYPSRLVDIPAPSSKVAAANCHARGSMSQSPTTRAARAKNSSRRKSPSACSAYLSTCGVTSRSNSGGHNKSAGARPAYRPATAATKPTRKNQNCRCNVTTSVEPMK